MTVLNLQVGASTDDALERPSTGVMNLTQPALTAFGNYSTWGHVGLRWTGVSGLSGATINSATLNFPYSAATDSGAFIADWYAHDVAAPGTFTSTTSSISDTAQRPRTTATCEGDGSDFGNWTLGDNRGAGRDFTGDGVNTIADIIQELADSYDPSAIVLLHIYASGTGERRPRSYDYNSIYGAKLDIDYTAPTGDQEATPDPVTVPVSIPAPTVVAGGATLNPDPVALLIDIPLPSVEAGGITVAPDPVTIPIVISAPTIEIGGITAAPAPVTIPIVIPAPQVLGAEVMNPDPVVIQLAIPVPTVEIGGVTASPDAVAIPIVIPAPQIDWQANPSPVTMPIVVPAPSIAAGGVVLSPAPVVVLIAIPTPTVIGAVEEAFVQWGLIERYIDPDEFAPGTVFLIEVGMFTNSVPVPAKARLFNVTDGIAVAGSEATTTQTSFTIVRSGTFDLLALYGGGLKKYRIEFGGEPGGVFYAHGGDVAAVSS